MTDSIGSANDGEGSNNRDDVIENDSQEEGEVLHSGEGPGHRVGRAAFVSSL